MCLQCGRPGFNSWVGNILWRRKWQPTPVLLSGESHGWRSMVGYSPWGRKESDTTKRLHFTYNVALCYLFVLSILCYFFHYMDLFKIFNFLLIEYFLCFHFISYCGELVIFLYFLMIASWFAACIFINSLSQSIYLESLTTYKNPIFLLHSLCFCCYIF